MKNKDKAKRFFYKLGIVAIISISIMFLIISVSLYFIIIFNPVYFNISEEIDIDIAASFGSFFGGLVGTTAGIVGSLLIVLVFLIQNRQEKIRQLENIYFKLIDCHRENVQNLSISDYRFKYTNRVIGRRAFVIFKLQIFDCLDMIEELNNDYENKLTNEEIIDIAYIVFYYGISEDWEKFSQTLFQQYEKKIPDIGKKIQFKVEIKKSTDRRNLGRTNQTSLSAYFRNFSNAIKLIDNSAILSDKQKYDYVKLFRSQLCNSEQLVLYFNVMSRFGKDWNEDNLLYNYSLIKNLPTNYVSEKYDFKKYYKLRYEDDEYN